MTQELTLSDEMQGIIHTLSLTDVRLLPSIHV